MREVLAATSIIETGGQVDVTGDGGHSEGPFQENDQGRGSGLSVAQRRDPYAATRRALKEFSFFKRKGYTGAELAYAAQRPRDRASYIKRFNDAIGQARADLGGGAGSATAPTAPQASGLGLTAGSVATPPQFLNISEISPEASGASAISKRLGGVFKTRAIPTLVSLGSPGGSVPTTPAGDAGLHQDGSAGAGTAGVAPPGPGGAVAFAAAPDYAWTQNVARRFGLTVTSTKRDAADQQRIYGGSGKKAQFTSRHLTQGAAGDFGGSPENLAKMARWAIKSGLFAEVFYDPVGQFDNGKFSRRGIGGHGDHGHLSLGSPALKFFYPGGGK